MGGYMSSSQKPAEIGPPTPPALKPIPTECNIIIPVDTSPQSETAFQWYLRHAHKPGNIVRIVHCSEITPSSPILAEHTFTTESWVEMIEDAKNRGTELINTYEKRLADNNIKGSVHFEIGKPGETVINAADKYNASQIVMGTRGFGVIRRTILGSVSEYVIAHTTVPVTVVPKETARWFK